MSEKQFSNREILLMFNEIKQELGFIKEQTIRTNGRTTKNEADIQNLNKFQVRVLTMWGVAVAGVSIVLNRFL